MFSESSLSKSLSFKLVEELKISPSSLTMFNYEEGKNVSFSFLRFCSLTVTIYCCVGLFYPVEFSFHSQLEDLHISGYVQL